tara:strand:+ start:421 stop:1311 length:891 start_codon:yes stop_codon:yes gene_type:complete
MTAIDSYSKYYKDCQQVYDGNGDISVDHSTVLTSVNRSDILSLDASIIDRIHNDFDNRLKDADKTTIVKNKYTKDKNNIVLVAIDYCSDLDGLGVLMDSVMPHLEQMFQSYLIVDRAFGLRSVPIKEMNSGTWLWHYDNYPDEVWKIIIYLTDVDEGSAPFEYLWNEEQAKGYRMSPTIPPKYKGSRIPQDVLSSALESGFKPVKTVGERGLAIFFQPNIVHRATCAHKQIRDVLTLQVRPCHIKPQRYISVKHTGCFLHDSYNTDPMNLEPALSNNKSKIQKWKRYQDIANDSEL